jgi:hypothetical protein
MKNSLPLRHASPEARSLALRHYGVTTPPAKRGYLQAAVASVSDGACRVASTLASIPRRIDRALSDRIGVDLAWSSAILTVGSAGSAFAYREPLRASAALHFHDRLGHLRCFQAVNDTIDSVRGANHRLKFGHTIFWLPSLIRQHGAIAIPGYTVHVLQDFTTVAGIPLFPGARLAALGLRGIGLRGSVATGLVTVNLAGALGAVSAGLLVYEVASLGYNVYRRIRERSRLISPERAAELFDAIERRLDQNGEKG